MLAIAGGKGGCGKTTTALGLARELARRGRQPLVVDADCDMPDLHHVARVEREFGVDTLARGDPIERAVQHSDRFPGVALVTAGAPDQTGAALRATADWSGPVLVDCPAGIGPDAIRPLRYADAALVVSTDEPQCLDDSRRTLTAARQLETAPVGALLRVVVGSGHTPATVGDCPVLEAVPTVPEPFDASALDGAWAGVTDAAFPPGAADNSTARTHSGEPTARPNSSEPRARTRHATARPTSETARSERHQTGNTGTHGRERLLRGRNQQTKHR